MTPSSGPLASAGAAAGHGLPGTALRRVLDHIEANLHRDPPLSELSARAYMSAFHFARLFKRSTGLPPHRFVVGRRIGRARRRLVGAGEAWRLAGEPRRQEAHTARMGPPMVAMKASKRFRRKRRARCARVFTTQTLNPSVSAISAFGRPSMSRSTSTVR